MLVSQNRLCLFISREMCTYSRLWNWVLSVSLLSLISLVSPFKKELQHQKKPKNIALYVFQKRLSKLQVNTWWRRSQHPPHHDTYALHIHWLISWWSQKYHFLQQEFLFPVLYISIVPQISPFYKHSCFILMTSFIAHISSKLKFLRVVTKCVFSVWYSYHSGNWCASCTYLKKYLSKE